MGDTLLGLTSVWPTKVTPSSITNRAARMSPNNSDYDGIGSDVAFDDRVVAQVEGPLGLDITFQFSIEGQFAGKAECAFEFHVGIQDVLGVIDCCAHVGFFIFWLGSPARAASLRRPLLAAARGRPCLG
jgi:hypothetical protein